LFVDLILYAAALGEGDDLLFDLFGDLRFRHLDGVEPLARTVGQVLFEDGLALGLGLLLGSLLPFGCVSLAALSLFELLSLLLAEFFESVVVRAVTHRCVSLCGRKNGFGQPNQA